MRILYLNTTYFGGGAEKVTRQIYDGMKARGHEVYEIVCYNLSDPVTDPHVHVLYSSVPEKIFHRLQTYNRGNHNLTIPYAIWYIRRFVKKHRIELIHLNNPHDNFLGMKDIADLRKLCPVVWTLHDFWALTGHCASPFGCENRWENGCVRCERLGNYPRLRRDMSGSLYKKKEKYLARAGLCLTVPSDWMKEQVRKSYLRDEACTVIYNSLDISVWKELDKGWVRSKYGLQTEKMVLAFVAADLNNPLKGMPLLMELFSGLDAERYMLLAAGNCTEELRRHTGRFETRSFGYITGQHEMNEFYAMADVLLNLSIHDTFGLVNIEAMASGTPVFAFDAGVLPEVVGQRGGWCVPMGNLRCIQEELGNLENDRAKLKRKAKECAAYVREKYNERKMLDQYETLYQSLRKNNDEYFENFEKK